MMKKKILITGTGGFIFSNFIRKAIFDKLPYTFVSVDKVTKASVLNNIYQNKSHTFHIGDIADSHFVNVLFEYEKPDIVIHGAAESFVDDSLKDPGKFITANVMGTQVITNACVKHKVERLIYASCYDKNTKAVTKSGLKSYNELKVGDLVLTINPETGIIEEKEIEKIIVQNYNGEMYHFKNKRCDFLTTPNHRYLYSHNNMLNWASSEELNILDEKKYFPIGQINVTHKDIINIPEIGNVDSDAFFYVCGAFIGDGFTAYQEKETINKSGSLSKSWRIFFDVPKNDKCRKKLEESLTKLDIKWHAEKNKSGEHIYFTSEKWLKFFNTFGIGAANKYIPDWMFNYSKSNLFNLLMGCHDSDGHGFNIKKRNNSITTVSIKLRDQLCYIMSMVGFHARFSKKEKPKYPVKINSRVINSNYDGWVIYFSNIRSPLFPKANIVNYNDKIWCLKVKDNKNFLVERNGITGYSGNTDEVYGQLESETEASWTEESPLQPRNPYSASKAAGELIIKAAHTSFGLNYNITRSSNNYGPRQTSEKLIPKVIKCVHDGTKIPIYGQGLQIRDWTYVMDNCAGIISVLNEGKLNETYNISANQEFTNIEVIQRVCNALGKGHDLISFIPDPRGGHDFRYSVDCSKLKELGWKSGFRFKEGIVNTVEWYQKNLWFLR